MNRSYIKCFAILVTNCYSSEIIDERNFDKNDTDSVDEFYKKYSDDKYRCFHTVIQN